MKMRSEMFFQKFKLTKMKLKILTGIAAALIITGLAGCYKDVYYPDFDPNSPISFSSDLLPIFVRSCSESGCHDAGPAHQPSLTEANAYNSIVNGGYINLTVPENSVIYSVVKSGEMPPTGALKSTDVQKILLWIKNGAPNN